VSGSGKIDDEWLAAARLARRSGFGATGAEIDKIMTFSGGKAIYRGNVVQRAFLDINCARAHVANNPFPYARNLGAMHFGFDCECVDI